MPTIPGKLTPPIIGVFNTFKYLVDPPQFITEQVKKYGRIFKINSLINFMVIVTEPNAIAQIFKNDNKSVVIAWPPNITTLLGPGSIAVLAKEVHVKKRKLLSQAFTPSAIDSYCPKVFSIINSFVDDWIRQGSVSNMFEQTKLLTFDMAIQLLLGVNISDDSKQKICNEFIEWLKGFRVIIMKPYPGTQMFKAMQARERIREEAEKIIIKYQKEQPENKSTLGILMEATDDDGNHLTIEELKDQILVILFAGHDTTSASISWIILALNESPEIRKKLEDELEASFKHKTLEQITPTDLKSLNYLNAFFKEIMRRYSPISFGFRKTLEPFKLNEMDVPAGAGLSYNIIGVHRDENIYPDTLKFSPERFVDPNNSPSASEWIPFGGGPRICLGMELAKLELKAFTTALLKRRVYIEPTSQVQISLAPIYRPNAFAAKIYAK